jgi:hypothetical protein
MAPDYRIAVPAGPQGFIAMAQANARTAVNMLDKAVLREAGAQPIDRDHLAQGYIAAAMANAARLATLQDADVRESIAPSGTKPANGSDDSTLQDASFTRGTASAYGSTNGYRLSVDAPSSAPIPRTSPKKLMHRPVRLTTITPESLLICRVALI